MSGALNPNTWRLRPEDIALKLLRRRVPNLGAQQISQGKTLRFRGDPVANTPPAPTGTGLRCHEPAHPAKGRLTALHSRSRPPHTYGFLQTRPHGNPPAPTATSEPPGHFRAAPLPHRCWVPPARAPGQDSHLRSRRHAWHTRYTPLRLAPLHGHRHHRAATPTSCAPLSPSGLSSSRVMSVSHDIGREGELGAVTVC